MTSSIAIRCRLNVIQTQVIVIIDADSVIASGLEHSGGNYVSSKPL